MSNPPPQPPRTRAQLQAAAAAALQAATAAAAAAAAAAQVGSPAPAPGGGQAAQPDPLALFAQLMRQQQLQAVSLQTQQALTSANADLAAAESLAQQRRAGAGPPPLFHGARSGEELAVNTWLDALESWFALAHVDADAAPRSLGVCGASDGSPATRSTTGPSAGEAAASGGNPAHAVCPGRVTLRTRPL